MGEHNFTATTDVRGQSYGGVEAHIERSTDNHENKNINVTKSHLNTSEVLLDYQQLKDDHYGDHVARVNKNRRGARGKSNSKYEDVNDYLRRTDGSCDTTGVQFFGNKELWEGLNAELLSSGLTESEITRAMDNGYKAYADGFNHRNEYVKMVKWTSNHDESTPHWHSHLFTQGVNANGKPLKSIDSALAMQMPEIPDIKGSKSNKVRLKAWRTQEDTAFFQAVSGSLVELANSKGLDLSVNMYRKDEHNGLTMSEYKSLAKQKEMTEKANSAIVDAVVKAFPNAVLKNGIKVGTPEGRTLLEGASLTVNAKGIAMLAKRKGNELNGLERDFKVRSEVLDERELELQEKELRLEKERLKLAEATEEVDRVRQIALLKQRKAQAILKASTSNVVLLREIDEFMEDTSAIEVPHDVKGDMRKDVRLGVVHLNEVKAQKFDDIEF